MPPLVCASAEPVVWRFCASNTDITCTMMMVAIMPIAMPTISSISGSPACLESVRLTVGNMISAPGYTCGGGVVVRRLVRPRLQPGDRHRELPRHRLSHGARAALDQRRDVVIALDV